MKTIKSKFSLIQTFLIPLYALACSLGLAVLAIWVSIQRMKEGESSDTTAWISLVFGSLGLLVLHHYYKVILFIKLNNSGICVNRLFGSDFIYWTDIESIRLTGKELESFLWISEPFEATVIELNNGEERVLFAKYYRNFHLILSALQKAKTQMALKEKVDLTKVSVAVVEKPTLRNYTALTKYSGNHFTSFIGIMFYVTIGFYFHMVATLDYPGLTVVLIVGGVFCLMLGLFVYQMHYFFMNEEYLIVRNHLWVFRTHQYRLADIKEVVIENPHRMSTSIRVITKDYKSRLYPAGSLRNKTWRLLLKDLEKNRMKVRNEAVH